VFNNKHPPQGDKTGLRTPLLEASIWIFRLRDWICPQFSWELESPIPDSAPRRADRGGRVSRARAAKALAAAVCRAASYVSPRRPFASIIACGRLLSLQYVR
jgi:hypothetical protein